MANKNELNQNMEELLEQQGDAEDQI
jgi:ribonuclease HI